jgi:hypothetical protein
MQGVIGIESHWLADCGSEIATATFGPENSKAYHFSLPPRGSMPLP